MPLPQTPPKHDWPVGQAPQLRFPEQPSPIIPQYCPFASVVWAGGWIENHSIRDYAKVLRVGFAAMAQDIESRLATAPESSMPPEPTAPGLLQLEAIAQRAMEAIGRTEWAEKRRNLAFDMGSLQWL